MIIVISPAKKLNTLPEAPEKGHTNPLFSAESLELLNILRKLSVQDLKSLMGLSDKLAELNVKRFKEMDLKDLSTNSQASALLFNGDTYSGLRFSELEKSTKIYAQDHLRILSGFYGLLRPFDAISPYRLEMGTKLKTPYGENLYALWTEKLTAHLNSIVKDQKALVNLASNEYFSAIDTKNLSVPVITPVFKELRDGKYKIISFNAKKARGTMARFILKNKLKKPEGLLSFSEDNYKFNESLSKQNEYVFTRKNQ